MPRPKPRIKAGPTLSHDNHDKVMACLLWWKARDKSDPDHVKAPHYFDACLEWHQGLSADDKETVLTLADLMGSAHKGAAESIAASLPPAPQCRL